MHWDYPHPYVLELTAQKQHLDELNHVNNAVYVQWMEDIAWQHSAWLDLGLPAFTRLDRSMAVLRHEIDYLDSAKLGDKLLLATWLQDMGSRIKLQRRFQLLRPADNSCLLRAKTVFVCVQMSSGRPRRMPQEFIEAYGKVWLPGECSVQQKA